MVALRRKTRMEFRPEFYHRNLRITVHGHPQTHTSECNIDVYLGITEQVYYDYIVVPKHLLTHSGCSH